MRQLEQALNRRLFVRDTHTLALTSDGRSLLVHARIILDAHERAERLFDAPGCAAACGWAPPTTWRWGLPDVLAARLAHPEVELDISIGVTSELQAAGRQRAGRDDRRRRGDRRGQTLHAKRCCGRPRIPTRRCR